MVGRRVMFGVVRREVEERGVELDDVAEMKAGLELGLGIGEVVIEVGVGVGVEGGMGA